MALAIVAILLTGCGTKRSPTSYTGSVRGHFVEACQGQNKDQQTQLIAPRGVCTCAYDQIRKKISFKRFKAVNDQLTAKPGPLPRDIRTIVDTCRTSG